MAWIVEKGKFQEKTNFILEKNINFRYNSKRIMAIARLLIKNNF